MFPIQKLLDPAAYPHPTQNITLIETHISWVILTGEYAYKIKKDVQYDFLDFSTLDQRLFYCREELRFNSRFAPGLYLEVVPICESGSALKVSGSGNAIEYAVKMRQFDNQNLLSHLAADGQITEEMIQQLAKQIAEFHLTAQQEISDSRYGSPEEIHHWFQGNFKLIKPLIEDRAFLQQIERLESWGDDTNANLYARMQQRKLEGFVRECHGDLHLGNITLINGKPTPFDGIEFNPSLHWIDVISEIAFTVMDLQQRGYTALSYQFLNDYLSITGDYEALKLLRYYLVYRALVRCKVALLSWQQHRQLQDISEARKYADLAQAFTQAGPPALMITHGFSGSGKSTYSCQLAAQTGAIHLRSDVERKRFLNHEVSKQAGVNQGIYQPDSVTQIYLHLRQQAKNILESGYSVIVDATFLQQDRRALFAQLATELNLPFRILDFQAPEDTLKTRVLQRQQLGNDPSEATQEVLQHQLKTAQPLTEAESTHTIVIDTCADDALNQLISALNSVDK